MLKSENSIVKNILIFFILLIGISSFFVVHEGQTGLLMRLGELVGKGSGQSYQAGLHLKIPFLDKVMLFDTRLQTFEQKSSRILTVQQKYVLVDYYVKWKIDNLPLFFKRNAAQFMYSNDTNKNARETLESLLSQKINNALRAEFGQHSITEVISGERINIMSTLLDSANSGAKSLGVKVVDVRIKRIDLPTEVSQSVFERMRADRERVATKHRSNGHSKAEIIQAQADADVVVIESTARASAAAIVAQGKGKAAKIYNDAYSKDQSFYFLYRSLAAYVNTFAKGRDLIVLRPKSSYFKYFKGPELK
jgi:membrane protease subunit HflC